MPIALIARDKPDHLDMRMATRAAHLDYLGATQAVMHAGPLLDEGGAPCGSLIVLDMDMAEAQAWADADPYALAGLFASVELIAWNKVIG